MKFKPRILFTIELTRLGRKERRPIPIERLGYLAADIEAAEQRASALANLAGGPDRGIGFRILHEGRPIRIHCPDVVA
jgi:hypothetical protein